MPGPRLHPFSVAAFALSVLALTRTASQAQILYDGRGGLHPNSAPWGWVYGAVPVQPPTSMVGSAVEVDTTGSTATMAGFTRISPTALDRTLGYRVRIDARVVREAHNGPQADKNGDGLADRAGFSLIVIGNDKKGLELAFWENEIWPQSDNPLFLHDPTAERAFVDTTATGTGIGGLGQYELSVLGSNYSLSINGGPSILAGQLRDYSSFVGPINPYVVSNLLFFGDNTTSASAKFRVSYVAVTPEPATWVMALALLIVVPVMLRIGHTK